MTVYTVVRREGDGSDERARARACALAQLLPQLGVSKDARVEKDGAGRPYFPDCPALFISISHAPRFTAVAVSLRPVGVDLECPSRIRDPEGIARRFFTEDERAALPDPLTPDAVCRVWTRKEAFGKYDGRGLGETLSISTGDPPDGAAFYTEIFADGGVSYCLTLCTHFSPARGGADGSKTRRIQKSILGRKK